MSRDLTLDFALFTFGLSSIDSQLIKSLWKQRIYEAEEERILLPFVAAAQGVEVDGGARLK